MRAMVIYESMFGNTRTIAEAVAVGLTTAGIETETVEVGTARLGLRTDADLVVVGAPTHTFTLSRAETRRSAEAQAGGELVSSGTGLREWLDALPRGEATAVAAFDTHVDRKLPGSASRSASKRLRRRGYRMMRPPESFYVSDMQGPLVDGELERARIWGAELGAALLAAGCHAPAPPRSGDGCRSRQTLTPPASSTPGTPARTPLRRAPSDGTMDAGRVRR